jgi:hypothetical protein
MVAIAAPLLRMAGAALAEALSATAGGAALAGILSASGDQEQSRAQADAQALPLTRARPCQCPPERGQMVHRSHGMRPEPRAYQGRITGFPYDVAESRWSMEWEWLGLDFDGFQPAQCLLQEAKGNYDQFLDARGKPKPFFRGFEGMKDQIKRQGRLVHANPPAKLMWYFQTPKARAYMMSALVSAGVSSIYQP